MDVAGMSAAEADTLWRAFARPQGASAEYLRVTRAFVDAWERAERLQILRAIGDGILVRSLFVGTSPD